MRNPLLQAENLSKNFDRLPVLKDVSFSIDQGEVIGLVGRQGAGKSTLLHLLGGAIPSSSGAIHYLGVKRRFSSRLEAQKLGIETVYQTSSLINRFDFSTQVFLDRDAGVELSRHTSGLVEQFNVTQNMLLGREATKLPWLGVLDWDRMIEIAQDLLAEFDLPKELAHEQVRNLSDEQRQVVLLLRMLSRPCQLLLLDDIIPILSFNRQNILLEKIRKLAAQGTSVIISSDDLKHLFTVTDRIVVLFEGRLVADRKTSESTPREIVELMVGSTAHGQVSPLIWALESYHTAQQQTEDLRRTQASLQQSLNARTSMNRQLVERLSNQLLALDQLNAALQATQRRLITEREDERKALARELHDQIIQDMLGLIYHLEEIEGQAGSAGMKQGVGAVRSGIRSLVEELRQMCSDLRPPTIDHHGLSAAINSLANEWSERSDIQVHLEIDPDLGRFPEMIELSLFRIVQEGLSNVRKHAAAHHVRISLQRTSSTNLLLRLEDDGQGLPKPTDLRSLANDKHFGLVGISERVALLGGTINIESSQGNGTILQVEIPSPYPMPSN
ncbi:MAG: ATP-binding cassette domain-containing protein [Chloroflexi bacterium]|nr:ATP-binding cassette domain-containing protein [Chloroflexota bacterium]MBI3169400.1 ATP-binding cassette domain-containing protein [Chloroflexota bacterium]